MRNLHAYINNQSAGCYDRDICNVIWYGRKEPTRMGIFFNKTDDGQREEKMISVTEKTKSN